MVKTLINIRPAQIDDASEISGVHDNSWYDAYRGIIPGRELNRMIARRGPLWWKSAIRRGSRLLVLEYDHIICGYASYGRNRVMSLPYQGELFELYLTPEFQGLGFGRRLFNSMREDLARQGYQNLLVWALADNDRALGFYTHLGGREIRRAPEKFGTELRERLAFAFD